MPETTETTAVVRNAETLQENVKAFHNALKRLNNPDIAGLIFAAIGTGDRFNDDIVEPLTDAVEALNNIRDHGTAVHITKQTLLECNIPVDDVGHFTGNTGSAFYDNFTARTLTGRKAVRAFCPVRKRSK